MYDIFTVPDMSAGQAFMWSYWYMSLFGILTILPYLVVFTFLYIIIAHPCLIRYFFSICSCPLPCALFLSLCSPCVLWLSLLLLWVVLLEYGCGLFLIWSRMALSWSVCVFLAWYHMYSSAIICVGLMCSLLHVIILPVVVTCILYDWLWWLWSLFPTIVPWVQGPLSSHWTTTVDPMGIDTDLWSIIICVIFALPVH